MKSMPASERPYEKCMAGGPGILSDAELLAVILRNDDFKNREALAARFEKAMEDIADGTENPWEQVHIAMGIVKYDREADHSIMDTIRRADKEMYSSKRMNKETEE